MDTKDVEILLEKYFEAGTTAEEEDKILSFFRNNRNLPEYLEKLRPMFEGIYQHRKEPSEKKFEKEISEMIDNLHRISIKNRFTKKVWLTAGVAAAIVAGFIYVSIWRSVERNVSGYIVADTYSDPQQGYEAAKKIIGYVSTNYNKGLQQLNNVPAYPEQTESLFKALKVYDKGFNKLEVITNINIK